MKFKLFILKKMNFILYNIEMIEFNVNQRVNMEKKVIKITTTIKFEPEFWVGFVVKGKIMKFSLGSYFKSTLIKHVA